MSELDINENSSIEAEETESENGDEALPASKYEIFSYPADTTLKGYLEQWNANQLTIPEFQRDYVWDQTRASKLIESFLLGLPVPPAFLYKPAQSKSFWIIDGQQRIRSIVDFQKGIFAESKFRLKGVDARWQGKTFEDLSDEDKFSLQTTVLRAIVIQQTHPADHSSIYHIFERLNTGGIRLNAMEVRQCVYSSSFLNVLKAWNDNPDWRNILGIIKPDKRLRDRELLLRVVALYRDVFSYEKPMKKFLNDCAIHYKELDEKNKVRFSEEMTDMQKRFSETSNYIVLSLGDKPFHLRGKLNFGALDAVFSTLMQKGKVPDLKIKFDNLVSDAKFIEDVSFNTSDESVLKRRFDTASKYLS